MPEPVNPATEPAATPAAPTPAAAAPTTPEPAQEPDWKTESRKHEARSKEYKAALDAAGPKLKEYEAWAEASKTELQKAQDAATAATAQVQAANQRAVKAEVKALAANGFADPEDAAAFLASGDYLTADGDVNTEKIRTDLTDLLARKPHLAKAAGPRTPAPNPAQGSSANGPTSATQLGQDDLKRMYKAGQHDEIAKARADGRFDTLLGVGQ